jgi:hypothetical protein
MAVATWCHGALRWDEWQAMPDYLREAAEDWAAECSERSKAD